MDAPTPPIDHLFVDEDEPAGVSPDEGVAPAPPPAPSRLFPRAIVAVFALEIVLVAVIGWQDRFQADVDGFAYLRSAHHYVTGAFDLAITGYWSPMLSWLMTPLLPLVPSPLFAARIVMGISSLVFTFGAFAVLKRLELPPLGVVGGTLAAALFAAVASVETTTPDLLVGGLLCLATSGLLAPGWPVRRRSQVAVGVLFGVAYYAKSVALPIGFVMVALVAIGVWLGRHARLRRVVTASALTLAVTALTVAPWVTVLSLEYDALTVSTTARIAHALPGPRDVDRRHPFGTTFAVPEPGRLSWWEDPSRMPYAYWSPFTSAAYLRHQIGVVAVNLRVIAGYMWAFDAFHLGMFGAAIGLLVHAPWRRNFARDRWRFAGLGVIGLCAIYLPVYALGARYYYATAPFLFAATFGVAWSLAGRWRHGRDGLQLVLSCLVILSFCLPSVALLPERLKHGGRRPVSMIVGERLRAIGDTGPIAGDTMEGLLTSYFVDEPFYGGHPDARPEDYVASGARLIVAVRSHPGVPGLDATPGIVSLDAELFGSSEQAARCPLKVYRIEPPSGEIAGVDP